MKSQVGLWIDHRKAVIVIVTDEGEETTRINIQHGETCPICEWFITGRLGRETRETDNLRAISTDTMTRSLRPSVMRNPS